MPIKLPKKNAYNKLKPTYVCSFEEDIFDIKFIDSKHMLYGLKTRLLIYQRIKNNRQRPFKIFTTHMPLYDVSN